MLLIVGKYPTDPGGVRVFERMKALNEALERCAEKKKHPLLLKLLRMTSAWKEFEPQYKKSEVAFGVPKQNTRDIGVRGSYFD